MRGCLHGETRFPREPAEEARPALGKLPLSEAQGSRGNEASRAGTWAPGRPWQEKGCQVQSLGKRRGKTVVRNCALRRREVREGQMTSRLSRRAAMKNVRSAWETSWARRVADRSKQVPRETNPQRSQRKSTFPEGPLPLAWWGEEVRMGTGADRYAEYWGWATDCPSVAVSRFVKCG